MADIAGKAAVSTSELEETVQATASTINNRKSLTYPGILSLYL